MRKIIPILVLLSVLCSCDPASYFDKDKDKKEEDSLTFAKGADISWITEMETEGYKFYDRNGKETECTALLKSIGFNAVRYRVWVDPDGGWCNKEDVLKKALRAKELGMKIMIDFHYSDWWADPGKQNVPSAWKSYNSSQMVSAVATHTKEVLNYLKNNKIDITWVQVGNEVENGMLWESGRVSGTNGYTFANYFNAGAAAVREIYPDARVILHISNSWNTDTLNWFYSLMEECKAGYDIIGLSLYPSYWENGGYPDWRAKTQSAVANFNSLSTRYGKPVMLVEFGMPASEPQEAKECLQYILDGTKNNKEFKGIFFWEPESEKSRNKYDYGAFADGKPTAALAPFNN